MSSLRNHWGLILINILLLLPLLSLIGTLSGDLPAGGPNGAGFHGGSSGAGQGAGHMHGAQNGEHNGGQAGIWKPVIHISGEWAMRWLIVCLSLTPLYILFGWRRPLRYRKLLGLYAFGYTALHVVGFIIQRGVWKMFTEWNFVLGLVSTLIMLALTVTSGRWAIRKLRKGWKPLHRFVYAAGALAVLHMALLDKGSWELYSWLLVIGLVLRLKVVKSAVIDFRQRLVHRTPTPETAS